MKTTKALLKEIIKMNNPTSQDIKVLREFVYNCLRDKKDNNLFHKAIKKLNIVKNNKGEVNLLSIVGLAYLVLMGIVLFCMF